MRANPLPPAAGWHWIVTGFAIFRRNPLAFSMLTATYGFMLLSLSMLPVIGTIAASALAPALAVGLMQVARQIESGTVPNLSTLFSALRDQPRPLLALGTLYLCCTLLALGLSVVVDDGVLWEYLSTPAAQPPPAIDTLAPGALVVVLVLTPVLMAWWFAPVLVAWHQVPLAKSLFFSLVACTLNWRAFLVYGLAFVIVAGLLPGLALSLLAVLFGSLAAVLAPLLLIPLLLVIGPVTFGSFYASYRDIFGLSEVA